MRTLLRILCAMSLATSLFSAQHTIGYLTHWTDPGDPIDLVTGTGISQSDRERNAEGLRRALNSHLLADGDTVTFPGGGVVIEIEGQIEVYNKDDINLNGGTGTTIQQFGPGNNTLIIGEDCSGWSIHDFTFSTELANHLQWNGVMPDDPTSRPTGRGCLLRLRGHTMFVYDNHFVAAYEFGVHIGHETPTTGASGDNVYVYGNTFDYTIGDGVHMIRGTGSWIASNTFNYTGDDSIAVNAWDSDGPADCYVWLNVINNAGNRGIMTGTPGGTYAPTSIHVGYNEINGTRGSGIEVHSAQGSGTEIVNNDIDGAAMYTMVWDTNVDPDVYWPGGTHTIGDSYGHAIYIKDSTLGFTVSGNTITNASLHGIFKHGGSSFSGLSANNSFSNWLLEDPNGSHWSDVSSGGPSSLGTSAAVVEW